MLIELHCHTSRYSACSTLEPVEMVRRIRRRNLQGVVVTEHYRLWTQEELELLRKEAEVEENFLLFAGEEVETDFGHVVVLGAPSTIGRKTKLQSLRRSFPEAALIWAHPFRNGREPSPEQLLDPRIDAVEIFNLNHTDKENFAALRAWHRDRFTAVGGSDAHGQRGAGLLPTLFDHPFRRPEELIEEIKQGRCRPLFKEIPMSGSNLTVTKIVIGSKGDDEYRRRLVVKKVTDHKKWSRTEKTLEVFYSIPEGAFRDGEFRVPSLVDVNYPEMTVIEEGQRGRLLFDLLPLVAPSVGGQYFDLAARWLARWHDLSLKVGTPEEARKKESDRLSAYRRAFVKTRNPHRLRAERLIEKVSGREMAILAGEGSGLVQVHGDYHPKNIIIGQDRMQDISTLFISVIDFDSSFLAPPAFDVGCFLAQYRYQLSRFPGLLERYRPERFVEVYREAAETPEDFDEQVRLFTARIDLSIASFLIKMGKGTSPELTALLGHAEAELAAGGPSPGAAENINDRRR